MTNLVEKLERVFFLNLLRQWLKLDEVAKLDTAFTTKCQRHLFLELLSKCNCKQYMNDDNNQPFGQILIEWMSRRNIPFDTLTVSSDTLNSSTIGIFGSETLTSLSCSHFWRQEQNFENPEIVSSINQVFSTIPNLSDIKLTNSKFVTGLNVTINCPHLTSCDFTFLTKLTDDFVVNLSQNCPQLTRVVLSQCKLLTDTSIVSLVKSCNALSFLHIGGCKKLTAATFQSIASECTQLTGFNMDYCSKTQQKTSSFGGFRAASNDDGGFGFSSATAATSFGVVPPTSSVSASVVPSAGGFSFGSGAQATSAAASVGGGGFSFGSGAQATSAPASTGGGFSFGAASLTLSAAVGSGGFISGPQAGDFGISASSSLSGGLGLGGTAAPAATSASTISPVGGLVCGGTTSSGLSSGPVVGGFGLGGGGGGLLVAVSHQDTIINIVRNNPLLTELYARDGGITNKLLLAIAECLPNFRTLDFSDCGGVNDDGLVPLAESCKLLSELIFEPPGYNVSGVTAKTFLAIATHCPEFKKFRLPSELISKKVLAAVSMDIDCVDLSARIFDCSHFRFADGANDSVKTKSRSPLFQLLGPFCAGAHTYRCDNLPNVDANVVFLEHMAHIKYLDLVCVSHDLADKHLVAISKQNVLLESFVISSRNSDSKCTHVGIVALVEKNPFLTKLDIGSCGKLTDATLAKIVEHCRGLKWLNIWQSTKITDEGFLALANNCRRLQYLDASGCIALTDVGIYNVITRCKELKTFLFNTYRFPDFDLQVAERYEMHFVVDKWARD